MPNEELEPSTPESSDKASEQRLNNAYTEAKIKLLKDNPLALLDVERKFAEFQQKNELEKKRGQLAAGLVIIMALSLIAFTILTVMDKFNNPNTRELITLFWTSQVGLVSSVVGYYFGAASKESK
jgi:hypothetical protein